jgi:hypothetical protein
MGGGEKVLVSHRDYFHTLILSYPHTLRPETSSRSCDRNIAYNRFRAREKGGGKVRNFLLLVKVLYF